MSLSVYAPCFTRKYTACHYYRIAVPLRSMERLYGANVWEDRGYNSGETSIQAYLSSDVNIMYSYMDDQMLHKISVVRGMQPKLREDGTVACPPVLIYDTDDNTDYVHPWNFSFVRLGVRTYPDGALLSPGDVVVTPVGDTEEILWDDNVTEADDSTFDIARNLQFMKTRHAIMRACDGVTVSSNSLASYMRNVIGIEHVHVFPNSIIPEDYEEYPLEPAPNIRIFWQGSPSHDIDWYPLQDAVKEVCERFPNVTWVIWGHTRAAAGIPPAQLEFHHWGPYEAYKLKRRLLRADINLCPLADNPFNRCKSAIKWYEASIGSRPEATLAANVAPYNEEMEDGVTGLLYSTPAEFVEKLSILIQNAALRKTLGHNAQQWVLNNRLPEHTVPGLWEFYHECRARRLRPYFLANPGTNAEIKQLAHKQGLLV